MRKTRKIWSITLIILMLFAFSGCAKEKKEVEKKPLEIGKYRVEKKENEISVITYDGTATNTTKYSFNVDSLISITITQKYSDKNIAKTSYNALIAESEITNQYTDIKLNNNIISFKTKDEMIIAYAGMTYDAIYDLLLDTYRDNLQE